MNLPNCITMVLLAVCLTAQGTYAQLDQETRDRMQVESQIGLSRILSMGGVEKELEMNENQLLDVAGLWSQVQFNIRALVREYEAQLKKADASDADALKKEFEKRFEAIREEELNTISKVLLPFQLERLKQIQAQYTKQTSQGMAMTLENLELTDQQKSRLKQIQSDLTATLKDLRSKLGKRNEDNEEETEPVTQESIAARMSQAKDKAFEDVMKLLTREQRDALASREGEPFEFSKPKKPATGNWLE